MRRRTVWIVAAAGVCLAASSVGCGPIVRGPDGSAVAPICGLGLSTDVDPHRAGMAAAKQAVGALGSASPRAVLVFDAFPSENRRLVLAGVATQVRSEVIVGCSTTGVLTSLGSPKGAAVAVLALGAEDLATATPFTAVDEADPRLSGEMIARTLPKARPEGPLFLLADCPAAALTEVVAGIKGVKGANARIVGGTAGADKPAVYCRGRAHQKVVVGVMLRGPFETALVSRSAGSVRAHTEESVAATARDAARALLAELGAPPLFVLLVSAGARRDALKDPAAEVATLQEVLGKDVPIVGFCGSRQIGPPRTGMPALALERHIVLLGIRRRGRR